MRTLHIAATWACQAVAVLLLVMSVASASAQDKKPNILVIWGDDIGTWNISRNNRGMMGYETPNIDRIATRASASPTIMPSRAARPDARHSSAATCRFEPA